MLTKSAASDKAANPDRLDRSWPPCCCCCCCCCCCRRQLRPCVIPEGDKIAEGVVVVICLWLGDDDDGDSLVLEGLSRRPGEDDDFGEDGTDRRSCS